MDTVTIKTNAGIAMPRIIYGTAWKKERTADLVEKAVQLGFRGIDTAGQPKHYREEGVGEALERLAKKGIRREELFIQSKFSPSSPQDPASFPYERDAPLATQVRQSFASSQENLKTSYLDSYVLHSPLGKPQDLMAVWGAMEELCNTGGVGQLGISNCYDLPVFQYLFSNAKIKPAVLQNRFYRETNYDKSLRAWCNDHGVIYQSFWSLTANPHILSSPLLRGLAQTFDRTEAQIWFRYLTHAGIVPLTGTSSAQHMQEDLAIFNFNLSPEQLVSIDALLI